MRERKPDASANASLIRVSLAVIALLSCGVSSAGAERYTTQGNLLGREIDQELIKRGYCRNSSDCFALLPMYGGHGNRVNFSVFAVGEKNRGALGAVTDMIVKNGIAMTYGVPIRLVAYQVSHEDYLKKRVFESIAPFLVLEINK